MNVKMNAMIYAILANGMFQKFCKALIILVIGVYPAGPHRGLHPGH